MCEDSIARFDTLHFQIRGWAASAGAGLAAAAFTLNQPGLMIVAACSTATFWLTEALHKTYQDVFLARSRHIQAYLRGATSDFFQPRPGEVRSFPCIGRQFKERTKQPMRRRLYRLRRAFFQPVVGLPYALIILLSMACWLLYFDGRLPPKEPLRVEVSGLRIGSGQARLEAGPPVASIRLSMAQGIATSPQQRARAGKVLDCPRGPLALLGPTAGQSPGPERCGGKVTAWPKSPIEQLRGK